MHDVLHYAFEYHERGWPVIPVRGKTPAVSWSAYQNQRPSLDQIREWFSPDRVESFNLAIVTGRISELIVVDCDTVQDAIWWESEFPITPLAVRTGGGGVHFYYRYLDAEVGNRTRILGRKIDLRAEGGLVVAPPSIHPQTQKAYKWKTWSYYALSEVPVFDPAWLMQESTRSTAGHFSQPHRRATVVSIEDGRAYIKAIQAVAGHGGHNATFRAACKLRDSGLTAEEAFDALCDWNETNAVPPWTGKELAHKVEDAFRLA